MQSRISKTLPFVKQVDRNSEGELLMKCRILRPKRLRISILQNSVNDIGKFSEIERELNLNADKKRLWFEKIESIDSKMMNESLPISLNYFGKDEI